MKLTRKKAGILADEELKKRGNTPKHRYMRGVEHGSINPKRKPKRKKK